MKEKRIKILAAVNSFKESLSSLEINNIIKQNLGKKYDVDILPISDGGDGFLEMIKYLKVVKEKKYIIPDPLNKRIFRTKILYDDENIYIESANVLGLKLIKEKDRNPFLTSSFGIGKLVKKMIKDNLVKNRKIVIGIGGTSTNDFGIGMANELGINFKTFTSKHKILSGRDLDDIVGINKNIESIYKRLKFVGIADVKNQLIGKNGTTLTYALQKGCDKNRLRILENGIKNLCKIIKDEYGIDLSKTERLGSGGGLAGGIYFFFSGKIYHWSEYFFNELFIKKEYDYVITGEGKIDEQSLNGKVIGEILSRFKKSKIILITGKCELKKIRKKYKNIFQVYELMNYHKSKTEAIKNVRKTIKKIVLDFKNSRLII